MTDSKEAIAREDHPEFWFARGIGSEWSLSCLVTGETRDLMPNISGFVRSREAGERVVALFKGRARLDFRKSEPNWIQVKVGCLPEHQDVLQRLMWVSHTCSGMISRILVDWALDGNDRTQIGRSLVPFQVRVKPWMEACFGPEISADRIERNHRFLEEALELVQANGCTVSEAHQLVDYVFGRPEGDVVQEIGGVMVTLAALCLAVNRNMHGAGEIELDRIWEKVEQIRAKQAAKPKHSPLPGPTP